MKRVLVLLSHPNLSQSTVNRRMAQRASTIDGVSVVDLYALYPRYKIDIDAEQARLQAHDAIVFQFPFYWYSTPALLKEWQDLVLEHGFAYGTAGDKLAGKQLLVATTAGGAIDAYTEQGHNHFSIRTLLAPLEQTATLCQLQYLPPFVLFSSLAACKDKRVTEHVEQYAQVLEALRDNRLDPVALAERNLLAQPALPIVSRTTLDGIHNDG